MAASVHGLVSLGFWLEFRVADHLPAVAFEARAGFGDRFAEAGGVDVASRALLACGLVVKLEGEGHGLVSLGELLRFRLITFAPVALIV